MTGAVNGFIVLDKPAGITSHDAIARVRRALDIRRVGHAGTLDPPATGVLLVGVGRGTRLLRFLEVHDKEYLARARFGVTTTTQDATGTILVEQDVSALTEQDVRAVLPGFMGAIDQIPPMVSAIKVGGERLYKAARRGEEVARAARPVTISALVMESFEHPDMVVRVVCSKGTYIRTLAADIGSALGVGAHLTALRRTRVGPFGEDDAISLDEVGPPCVRPMGDALAGYPRVAVDGGGARALVEGKRLAAAGIDGPYGVWGPDGLVGVCEDRGGEARSLCIVAEI
jgi:tRNA pseudouridine55 synthase